MCRFPSVEKQKHGFQFFRSMYNKTIIRFGFCEIQNNQGLGKGYEPQPCKFRADSFKAGSLVTCQGKIWLFFFLVAAVAVAVRAKSGTPGKRDLISLTRPQNFLNEVFLFELNHIVLF